MRAWFGYLYHRGIIEKLIKRKLVLCVLLERSRYILRYRAKETAKSFGIFHLRFLFVERLENLYSQTLSEYRTTSFISDCSKRRFCIRFTRRSESRRRLRNEVTTKASVAPWWGHNFPSSTWRKSDKPSTILVTITPQLREQHLANAQLCKRAGCSATSGTRVRGGEGGLREVARGEGYKINSDLDF